MKIDKNTKNILDEKINFKKADISSFFKQFSKFRIKTWAFNLLSFTRFIEKKNVITKGKTNQNNGSERQKDMKNRLLYKL